ncbi:MAG: tRNA 5-methylaminomethyl-2-thiouridine biosynthesis bifunctional protein, partial [Halieaceae bacterium]
MIRSTGPLNAMQCASLSWSDSDEPQSTRYDDCYLSRDGGHAESDHIFLEGNRLAVRFRAATA